MLIDFPHKLSDFKLLEKVLPSFWILKSKTSNTLYISFLLDSTTDIEYWAIISIQIDKFNLIHSFFLNDYLYISERNVGELKSYHNYLVESFSLKMYEPKLLILAEELKSSKIIEENYLKNLLAKKDE